MLEVDDGCPFVLCELLDCFWARRCHSYHSQKGGRSSKQIMKDFARNPPVEQVPPEASISEIRGEQSKTYSSESVP